MASKNSITTCGPDSKLWVCGNCHIALVLPKDFTSKLNRDGIYSGFCLFETITNVLPGKVLIDGTWVCRLLHCIRCNKRVGGKYLQVPIDHAAKDGKVFLKMAKVCFFDGKSLLDAAIGFLDCLYRFPANPHDDLSDCAQWVQLNVGGKIFSTTIDTLTKEQGSVLQLMFNGGYKLTKKNECVMIDRDGTYFNHILNWLRGGILPLLEPRSYTSLAQEADFYNLVAMKDAIEELSLQCTVDLTRKEVMENVLAGKMSFKGLNLSGQDLSYLNLESAEFSYACLHGVNFKGAHLRDAKLDNCDALEACFDGADLGFSSLLHGNFIRSSFVGASIYGAKLIGGDFSEADFTKADLSVTTVTNTKLDKAIMKEAKLPARLYRIALEGGATF